MNNDRTVAINFLMEFRGVRGARKVGSIRSLLCLFFFQANQSKTSLLAEPGGAAHTHTSALFIADLRDESSLSTVGKREIAKVSGFRRH